jgi:uncharacterized protein YndB with AHSA1/START domain
MATLKLPYGRPMTNATIPDTIERTTELPQPVNRVWAALTDPAEFGRWFSQSASWELREGAPMTMSWEEHGTAPGLIVEVSPMTRFAYRWGSEDRPLEDGQSTLVTWTLAPTADGGTTLTVVESGFATLYNGPEQIKDNTGGWQEQFENIARYLAGG